MSKLGVLIVGVNGAVASTLVAGVELMNRGLAPRLGMVTEPTDWKIEESLTNLLEFTPLEDLVFAGWDVRFANVYEGALHHKVLPRDTLEQVKDKLEAVKPWPAIFAKRYAQNVEGDNLVSAPNFREEIATLTKQIEELKKSKKVERCVLVNLASTESYLEPSAVHATLANFEAGLDKNDPAISPSMRYFYACTKMGIPSCNFTPSLTNVPALQELSKKHGVPYAGMDGKTGQTLLKTALAPMLRARRLFLEGWFSTNILGNNDGLILNNPGSNKTKVLSKAAVLDSIVGYPVQNHQVHIQYYKPRGDAKEAWDAIDIVGFAGIPMQIKVNFLCQDSALAAPLVVDLVRLLDVAKKVGSAGIQRQLSIFFKSPHAEEGEQPVHDLFKQEKMLLDWAKEASTKLRGESAAKPATGKHAAGTH
jgi:myo-inositol-1-phosphate synthase